MKSKQELFSSMKELKTLLNLQLEHMSNDNGGIPEKDFLVYLAKPSTKELFSKIYEVKAALRAQGVVVPNEFPEKNS